MNRLKLCTAITFGLVLSAAAATHAAEREPDGGPQWPNITVDEPRWPNLRLDDIDAPRLNRKPSFLDPQEVEDRIMGRKRGGAEVKPSPAPPAPTPAVGARDANASARDANASAARWPAVPEQPSPFAFEVGARYWYSAGSMKFGFTNGQPIFGNPTSTLDWYGLAGHTGEVFARVDHLPSGVFFKGMIGGGSINDGHIDDRDFFVTQFKFSDTQSDVTSGSTRFAMFDIGWAYSPVSNLRLGFFAGYHYWHEKVTANGLVCNMASILGCPALNAVPIGFGTAVLGYEPTAHAVRIGVESKLWIDDRWSVSGEIAGIPYASMRNNDSHLLRSDLGPTPNIATKSSYAYGVEAEIFVNYAVTPNIEVGAGLRYWGIATRTGDVRFGPDFAIRNELTNFDLERYGVLVQAKGRF